MILAALVCSRSRRSSPRADPGTYPLVRVPSFRTCTSIYLEGLLPRQALDRRSALIGLDPCALALFEPNLVKGLVGKLAAPRLLDPRLQEVGQHHESLVFAHAVKGRGVAKRSAQDIVLDA